MDKMFGVDIGGTKCAISLIQEDGVILKKEIIPTFSNEKGESILNRIIDIIQEMDDSIQQCVGVGIGSAGQISEDGRVISSTDTFQNWQGLNIQMYMEKKLSIPVKVVNDVQAMALGEVMFGAAIGSKNMICLALGTGVGGGIVIDGRLYRGHRGAAGEFGHLTLVPDGLPCTCGRNGCVEAYLSGKAIERAYMKESGVELKGSEVFSFAKQGDPKAEKVVDRYICYLIVTIKSLITIFNPEKVIIEVVLLIHCRNFPLILPMN